MQKVLGVTASMERASRPVSDFDKAFALISPLGVLNALLPPLQGWEEPGSNRVTSAGIFTWIRGVTIDARAWSSTSKGGVRFQIDSIIE